MTNDESQRRDDDHLESPRLGKSLPRMTRTGSGTTAIAPRDKTRFDGRIMGSSAATLATAHDDNERSDHGRGRLDLGRDWRDGLFALFRSQRRRALLVPVQNRTGIDLVDKSGGESKTDPANKSGTDASASSAIQRFGAAEEADDLKDQIRSLNQKIERLGERVDRLQQLLSLAVPLGSGSRRTRLRWTNLQRLGAEVVRATSVLSVAGATCTAAPSVRVDKSPRITCSVPSKGIQGSSSVGRPLTSPKWRRREQARSTGRRSLGPDRRRPRSPPRRVSRGPRRTSSKMSSRRPARWSARRDA